MDRSQSIGSSDVAGIVGISPWSTPFSVYAEKVGLVVKPESEAMKWGKRLQRAIAEEWGERNKVQVAWLDQTATDADVPYFSATPDGEVVPPDLAVAEEGVEVKTANWRQRDRWGEEGTDQIPAEYVIQATWQAMVKKWKRVYVPVLWAGNEMGSYVVEFDQALAVELRIRCDRFWREHVQKQNPPPLDWTESAAQSLKERFPLAGHSLYRDSTAEEDLLVGELAKLKRKTIALERAYDTAVNRVKEKIGFDKGLRGPGYVVSWYNTRATHYEVYRPASRGFRCRGEIFDEEATSGQE